MGSLTRILCERRRYTAQCYTHAHIFAQLILPLQGTLRIQTEIYNADLKDDHLFFFPPFCDHTFHSKDNNEFLVLDIPEFFLSPQEIKKINGGLYKSLDHRWQALRLLMLNEADSAQGPGGIHELFRYASRLLLEDCLPPSIQFIHEHYQQKITLQQLADLEHYHPAYYCGWFQKTTGQTPMAYIKNLRLTKAKELLAESSLPVLQIAQEVGYEHHSTLSRVFKEQEKISPAAYRERIQRSAK